jgi:hypothetical protein
MIAAVMRPSPSVPNRAWGTPLRLSRTQFRVTFLDDFAIAVLLWREPCAGLPQPTRTLMAVVSGAVRRMACQPAWPGAPSVPEPDCRDDIPQEVRDARKHPAA